MSNEVKKPNQIEIFPIENICSLEISGGMSARLIQLFNYHASIHQIIAGMSQEESLKKFAEAGEEIKNKDVKSSYAYHLETLLVLIKSTEDSARSQGKLSFVDPP